MSEPQAYRIRIAGRLGPRWAAWFGEFALEEWPDDSTTLVGLIVDQAALHGLLARVRDLGLELVSVERLDSARERTSRRRPRKEE